MRARSMAYVAVAVLAVACGGGGDDGGGDDDGGGGSNDSYCSSTSSWSAKRSSAEDKILELVNQRRAQGATCGGVAKAPVKALKMNAALQCAARVHTADMAAKGYFDHTNPAGQSPFDRMTKAGYRWGSAGENIAQGSSTPEGAMDQWMNSPPHCNNIMGADYVDFGAGYVEGKNLWTQTFGRPL